MESFIFDSIFAGIFSCIAMDIWQKVLFLTLGIPPSNWSLAGRWLIMLINKKVFVNLNLDNENPIKYELQIGWVFHYCVGIGYGFTFYFFLAFFDTSIFSGFIFGLISVVIPWFFFLPVTGKGIMGNNSPNPNLTKLLSIGSHVVLGISLAVGFSFLGY